MHHTLRFYVLTALTGGLVGLIAAGFLTGIGLALDHYSALVNYASAGLGLPRWLAAALLSAAMVLAVLVLLRQLAPEAAGSGVHELEAHLDGVHPLRWRRVLPAKFVGGVLALGSQLTVGPEGPAVHMGGAIGRMIGERMRCDAAHGKALVCAGAAAGLAAVFNAPIAGFLFIIEQMRRHFPLSFVSFHGLVVASWTGAVVAALFLGQALAFPIKPYQTPALLDLTLFLVMGVGIGALGAVYNKLLLATVAVFGRLHRRRPYLVGPLVGAATGVLFAVLPESVGSGQSLTLNLFLQPWSWQLLLLILAVRLVTTTVSYAAETPGGIFAPLLALGALSGLLCGQLFGALFPGLVAEPGVYALAAMGALFAATFRIPLTAIVLVLEITGSGSVALAMIASCLAASLAAQALGAKPIYEELLARLVTEQERPPATPGAGAASPQRRPTTKSPTSVP